MAEMKRGNPNQKTLFQSWGKSKQQVLKTEESKNQNHSNNNLIEIIDLDDDDDDDGLLAAALEMESIDSQTTQENVKPRAGNVSNISEISVAPKEVEYLPGFDMESGNVWVYPTNYPIRDYQFEIVEKALFMNTLVTLPTGLGKTFIAAVLMYNYYRWYPQGKVIFMAPTKPLVAQQIEACFNIMGIPESDTAQMTGTTAPNKREEMWKNKRVFFLTPQVLQNDLSRGSCSAEDVVLLVFDEAHKALGNHAYSQVVREISNYTRNFRVLALSATPGDDIKSVQQVMTNLLISHMELRSEDSPDIQPYTHSRTIDKIVVPLGEDIARIKTHFLKVLEGIIGRLFCNRALWQKDPQRVTKYMLLNGRDQFRKRNLDGYTNGQKGAIEGDFAMAISLYHAYELLHQHGILSFYNFIKAIIDGSRGMVRAKTEIKRNSQFMDIMEELRESIECPPDETAETSALFSQFTSPRRRAMHKQAFDPSFKSHPKLLKLEEVIVEHFQRFSSTSTSTTNESAAETKPVNTRVMIFSQFRDSVGEITAILSKHKPLVRVMSFIGQATTSKTSRGLSQKEQLEVVQRFRKGGYNTLVATCVGEEGLDIGDVDLIVCFDAHASPIRLVQRMGRTGRKRNGRIVVLVSEGKEEQIYKRSLSNKKSIHKAIVQGSKSFELYDDNPRMIPRHLTPRVLKMQMTVGNFVGNNKKKRKSDTSERKSSNITSFLGKPGTSKSPNVSRKDDGFLTYEELIYWQENFKLPNCEAGTTPQNANRRRSRKSLTDPPVKELSLNEWMAWQNVPSQVYKIAHSRRTQHLIEILEFIELHGERDGGDDTYDVEMMTFLNEEDLLRPEDDAMILGDADYDGDNNDKLDDKTEKSKKKKKSENENDGEKKKNNNAEKQSKITKKSKKSKSISPQQKTKWREYLKGFENDDNDFDTGEVESKTLEEKQDNELTSYIDEVPHEILYENEESAELTEKVLPENNATEMEEEDDAFEVSSQNFSQLLPSLTPKKVNVLRTRITDVTENHAKDIPLPPSLDSLDEISPFTFDKNSASCDRENTPKFCREKIISCRRKINQFDEHKTADIGCEFGEKSRSGNKKLTKCLTATTLRKCDIEEPPDLDLELDFGNEMGGKWKHNDNASKKLTKNFSTISHKKDLIEDPPELDFENDFGEFSNEDENLMFENDEPLKINKSLRVKSQTRSNGFPKQTVPLIFGENEDDFQEKPSSQHTKPRDYSGFGAERNNVFPKQTDPMIFEENEDDFQEKASSQRSKPRDNSGFGAERNNVFPKQTDPMMFGRENEDDFQEKASSQSTKLKDNSGFGLGVVCKNKNGVFDDDIEIEFGDDSLADGLFADLDEKEFERNCFSNQSKTGNIQGLSRETLRKSKDEREKNLHIDTQEDEIKVHGENNISRCETAPKQSSKLKLNSKEKSLCDNSLKNSILKLGAFERNAENSTKKPFNCFTNSEGIFDHSTHNRMGIEKSENTSEAHSNLPDNPGENPQRKEEFNFKKPDAFLGNRSIKSNRSATVSVKACKDTNHENGETISPVFTSSPLRKSLKLNSKTTLKKQDNRELSSCSEFEEEKNLKLSKMQKNQKQSCSPLKEITSPCPSEKYSPSFDITHNEAQMKKYDAHNSDSDDSPILKKPLRERLANRCLEDNVNNINSKCNQKDLGMVLNGEDSPVVTKKSKIRTLQNIAAISPLQGSQNSLRGSDSQEGESPVVRRRSKAKIRDGNVFAIAESDEEFEDDIQETSLQLIEDEVCNEGKAQEMDVNKIKGLRNRKLAGTSESEEDFLQENRKDHIQGADGHHQRKIVLQDSVKRKRLCSHPPAKKQKRLHANHFLDEEASLSGSDIDQFTDEESDRSASSEFDSFIDDSTQLTQRTPTQRTSRNPRSPMDMAALYRQSLMSPHARNLNFRTPSFRTDKNRYKMNFNPKRTGSESEAEETHAHESDLENELGFDNEEEYFEEEEYGEERWYGDDNESPHNSVTKLSPQSQVQRPLNRAKRKYVLNDSVDEDIVACKRTPLKTSTKSNTPGGTLQSTQAFHHKKYNTISAVPPKTNSFTASSSLLTKENNSVGKASASISSDRGTKWNFKDRRCIALTKTPDSSKKNGSNTRGRNSLSATFDFDWDSNGFSDSDLLEAVEDDDKNDFLPEAGSARNTSTSSTTAKFIQDQEMQDIAFAMAATDQELNLEISEMPTFSLGLDFLGDDTEQQTTMKDNQKLNNHADLKKRMSTLTDPPFALKQNLPHQKQQQQNGSQESKFTKIVPPQRPGESNTRVFSFKSSSAATVKPFNKGIQNSTTNSQNIVKNISSSGTMCDSNDTSDGTKGSSSSDGHLIKPIGGSGNNSSAYTTTSTDRGKCQTNWCLDTSDRKRESTTSTPDSTPKNIPRAFVSPSRRDRDKLVILVDTKEICNAQVVSCLRRKHNIKAEVCQLIHCDYVVSNRVGVIRKLVSAVANGANATKLVDKMRLMCDLYDRPCLIIEKDRVKPGEKERDWSRSHAYSHTLACIAQTHIKVLFSESQEDTAALLTELASMEAKKKAAIQAPLTLNKETQQVFRFLLSIPRVSYITALNLCSSLRTLRDLISSTPDDLQKITKQLSLSRATEIYNYLKHNFDEGMTAKKKNP